jgi:hypothetical protein
VEKLSISKLVGSWYEDGGACLGVFMKITLDLSDLVAKGQLTEAEANRLKGLASVETGALGVNILLAFGTTAVSLGIGVLIPSIFTAIALGALLFGVGFALVLAKEERWRVFAQICMVIGAIGFTGGVSAFSNGNFYVNLVLVVLTGVAAVLARSGLLAAVAVIGLTTTVGTAFSGWESLGGATVVTIIVLSALTLALYQMSLRIEPVYERVAIIAARTAILMINFAFLFGSLFGDSLIDMPKEGFSIVWALLLLGVGLWAVRANRPWVVNIAAVFGAIHFFVQWFVYLGASPFSVLGGGLLFIAFGFALKALNDRRKPAVAAT